MRLTELVCLAQARVIAGRTRKPHVCTIALHNESGALIRVCLPFASRADLPIRRWTLFDLECDNDPRDQRDNTYSFGTAFVGGSLSPANRFLVHQHLLSLTQPERIVNEQRKSINVLVPDPTSVSYYVTDDEKAEQHKENCAKHGLFFPEVKVRVKGKTIEGKPFDKQLVDWQVIETIRRGDDPFGRLTRYALPYFITGNLAHQRNTFIAVSVFSAPPTLSRCFEV